MKSSPKASLILFLLFCGLHAAGAIADVLTDDRLPPGRMWSNIGVPGGVEQYLPGGASQRVTIGANVVDFGAVGDGITDCTTAFRNAINACPANQVVLVPDGVYRITDQVLLAPNRTIRGNGPSRTRLLLVGAGSFYTNADFPSPNPTVTVLSGATKGNSVLTVDDASSVVVGRHVTLTQLNPSFVKSNSNFYGGGPNDDGHDETRLMAVTFVVTAKDDVADTVTLDHPVPITMSLSPMLTVWRQFLYQRIGFEDMTVDCAASTGVAAMRMYQVDSCWFYNVNFINLFRRSVWFQNATNCTVQRCHSSSTRPIGAGANTEGLDLVLNACWNLIQDNSFDNAGYPMIVVGDWGGGCAGNVIAYNFVNNETGATTSPYALSNNHGGHNMFNLWEGNYAQNFASDGYYGSDSHITLHRNYFSGQYDRTIYDDEAAIILCHWASSYNITGNILGVPGYSLVLEASGTTFQDGVIYRFGYPNVGNRSGFANQQSNPSDPNAYDTNVKASAVIHGNYDFVTNSQQFVSSDLEIRPSYYLTAKPAWFGNLAWPAIDPGTGAVPPPTAIPAGFRFVNGIPPPPDPNPPQNPPPGGTQAPSNARVQISVN